jgi:uncharacterized protein YfiM (DUF2279 family)
VHQGGEQLSAAGQHARDFITHLFFGSPDMQAAMEAFAVREQVSVAQQTSPFFSSASAIGSSAGLAAAAADASNWSVQSVTCDTVPAAANNVLTSSDGALVSDEASPTVNEAITGDEQSAVIEQSEAAAAGSERVHEHADRLDTPMKAMFTQEQHGQGAAADKTESLLHRDSDHSDCADVQTTTSAASIPPRLLRRLSQRG